uniref:Histone H3.v1-like n=1 Tax=Diabrotica virgifera virgifera TaxID=50390 RepID=A0A6P7GZE0_DIAVI
TFPYGENDFPSQELKQEPKGLNDDDFNHFFNDDGLKTTKQVLTSEHFEIQKLNPNALNPADRFNVRGSYKVQETDPFDITTTSYHTYNSPFTKKVAKALTNFSDDKPTEEDESEDHEKQQEEQEQEEDEGESNNIEEYEDNGDESRYHENEVDDGDGTENTEEHTVSPDKNGKTTYNMGRQQLENFVLHNVYDERTRSEY